MRVEGSVSAGLAGRFPVGVVLVAIDVGCLNSGAGFDVSVSDLAFEPYIDVRIVDPLSLGKVAVVHTIRGLIEDSAQETFSGLRIRVGPA